MSNNQTLAAIVLRLRTVWRITQLELAERADVSARTIASIEAAKGCSLSTLVSVLDALNASDEDRAAAAGATPTPTGATQCS